jgi:aminobenzoyl-glutamate utilization protein A
VEFEQLRAFRRELHRNPEPAFTEIGTAARIEQAIAGLPVTVLTGKEAHDLSAVVDYPAPEILERSEDAAIAAGVEPERARYFRENGTALVVDLNGSEPGPAWGLRVDIDALPMRESTDLVHFPAANGFAATNGAMHACGHDANATMGVGLLHRLADRNFAGSLRVFFQPAEEGVRGAQTMIDAGVADGIDRMLAIHMAGGSPFGTVIGSFTGGMATRKLKVNFDGRASHAAGAPEAGRNALLAASMSALAIMAVPRFSSADTRLNVGTLVAGDGVNIVPSSAVMTCEARATDDLVVDELVDRIRSIVAGTAAAQGVDADIAVMGQSATLTADDELIDRIVGAAATLPAVAEVIRSQNFAGSDDANLLIRHVQGRGGQGAYVMVGASSPGPHHSETFDLAEDAMAIGIDTLEALIRSR